MKRSTNLTVLFLGALVSMGVGCAGSTPPAEAPEQSEATPPAEGAPEGEAPEVSAASAHTLDVGMEFKEKDDTGQRRASHDAPPTSSWKPVEKDKSLDTKAPKK